MIGVHKKFRTKNEKRTTAISFTQSSFSLNIEAANGNYKNAVPERSYQIVFHGLSKPVCFEVNGKKNKY